MDIKYQGTAMKKGRPGQVLIMAMIFLLALTFLGFGLITMATMDRASSKNLRLTNEVFEAAEEGVIAGMAYAADPVNNFAATVQNGYTVFQSTGNYYYTSSNQTHARKARLQYEVRVIMRGDAPSPMGAASSNYKSAGTLICNFAEVEVQSTGYVYERPYAITTDFNFASAPAIRRNISVRARIKMGCSTS